MIGFRMRKLLASLAVALFTHLLPASAAVAVPYYAAGNRIEGAVAFDMATIQSSKGLRSIRIWQFSPTPIYTDAGFKAGDVQTVEFDCGGSRVRFKDRAVFTSVEHIELQPKLAEEWSSYQAPIGNPDNSLATTAWLLLCGRKVPANWVAYDRLEMIAFDYWSSLIPAPVEGIDPHGVQPPTWAGGNAAEPTGPKTPDPIIPW
jgi:hypothetical protein